MDNYYSFTASQPKLYIWSRRLKLRLNFRTKFILYTKNYKNVINKVIYCFIYFNFPSENEVLRKKSIAVCYKTKENPEKTKS